MMIVNGIETTSALVDGVRHHEDDEGNHYVETDKGTLTFVGKMIDAPRAVVEALHPTPSWEKTMTCREAAERFRRYADKTPFESERHRNDARAEILEMFGDAPVPPQLIE